MADIHARAQLRTKVAELLGGLPTTGTNVFPSRVYPLDEDRLPSLSVYVNEEPSRILTVNRPPLVQREPIVLIEGHAVLDEGVDDLLDQIALEVEAAMAAEVSIAGKTISTQLINTEIELNGDGELQIGVIRLSFRAAYSTFENRPQSLA